MLFRKKVPSSCEYCAHGAKIDEDRVLCAKKGVINFEMDCRKFQYDPLKRIPPRRKAINFSQYDNKDFSL